MARQALFGIGFEVAEALGRIGVGLAAEGPGRARAGADVAGGLVAYAKAWRAAVSARLPLPEMGLEDDGIEMFMSSKPGEMEQLLDDVRIRYLEIRDYEMRDFEARLEKLGERTVWYRAGRYLGECGYATQSPPIVAPDVEALIASVVGRENAAALRKELPVSDGTLLRVQRTLFDEACRLDLAGE